MATKPREFNSSFYYHIYNCGVEKRDIFETPGDYRRFLEVASFYRHDQELRFVEYAKLDADEREDYALLHPTGAKTLRIRIITYCLMPNHFHLVLKLVQSQGITKFISDICNSHSRYFNSKNERIGKLYQGPFKAKEIRNEPSLFQLTRYIHLNPIFSLRTNPDGVIKPENYFYSSYTEWIDSKDKHPTGVFLLEKKEIKKWISDMGGPKAYESFVESKITERPEREIEDLIIEEA